MDSLKSSDQHHIVIVGGTSSGIVAAARLRRLNPFVKITVFEKGKFIGYATCGLPYLFGQINLQKGLFGKSPAFFKKRYNIDCLIESTVTHVDTKSKSVSYQKLGSSDTITMKYSKLVLATGTVPFCPPIPGLILGENATTLRVDQDATDLIKHISESDGTTQIVIVGGGFIGVEIAEQLSHFSYIKVTLIELLPQVMPPLDPEFAEFVSDELIKRGVNVVTSDSVTKFEKVNGQNTVFTKSGKSFPYHHCILSIGVRPNTKLAIDAGITINPKTRCVQVNDMQQTSNSDVFAVGECADCVNIITKEPQFLALAGPAHKSARVAANNLHCDLIQAPPDSPLRSKRVPVCGSSIIKCGNIAVAQTGLSENIIQRSILKDAPYSTSVLPSTNHVSYYPGAENIYLKIIFDSKSGRIYGAEGVGIGKSVAGIDKRIDIVAALISAKNGNASIHDLGNLDLCYSPIFNSPKDPLHKLGYQVEHHLQGIKCISAVDLLKFIKANPDVFVLDVRSSGECKRLGCLENSTNIAIDDLVNNLEKLPQDKSTKILVHCQSGLRSYLAQTLLIAHGWTDTINVSGGWQFFKRQF